MKKLYLIAALMVLMTGCGNDDNAEQFSQPYLSALEHNPGAPVRAQWLDGFVQAYGDFTGDQLRQRIREAYAERLYFNDTLRSIKDRETLADYLSETADRLEDMQLTILDRHLSGRDAYLRWTLRTRFQAGWRSVDTTTLGMTHLRFNERGQVILHQDFWDSRQGVFEHIPVMGGMINWVRKRL